MIENKHFNKIILVLMICAVLLSSIILVSPSVFNIESIAEDISTPDYVEIFEDDVVDINIDIEEENWEWLIENALLEEYTVADVTINGETYYNVGLRPKGNSSLDTVAKSDETDRYSFKIKFDEYIDGQTFYGLERIALNNMISDATYMKEYLSYELFSMMGVPTPLYTFVNITINGEPWGLYLMVETDAESYIDRNFGTDDGVLYKPENSGSDLVWKGEDWSNYSGIQTNAMVDITDSDFEKVVEMIKNLDSGTNLEEYIDVDTTLRYFAVNTLLVNMDSYAGQTRHNYYLYEEDGIFSILPWDLNMSFGGFQIDSAQVAIDFPIDTPYTGSADEVPLISKLFEVPEYKEQYYEYLDEAVELFFDSGFFENEVYRLDSIINEYVKNDATAFYTYEEYENSLPVLIEFGKLRAASVTAQLSGQTVSTEVDFEMSDLGSMPGMENAGGGGMMPGGNAGDMEDGMLPGGDAGDMQDGMMPGRGNAGGMQGGIVPGIGEEGALPDDMLPPEGEEGALPDDMLPPEGEEGTLPDDMLPPEGEEGALPDDMLLPDGEEGDIRGNVGNMPVDQTQNLDEESLSNVDPGEIAKYSAIVGLYIVIMIIGIAFAIKFDRKKLIHP